MCGWVGGWVGLVLSVLALGLVPRQDVTVVPTKKMDEMQSFVMAETFKYLYLLFSPNEARAGVQALNPKP